MSLKPSDSVEKIPGVGPKYQKLLQLLEIYTIKDLIYHFPFRYDDYSQKRYISELKSPAGLSQHLNQPVTLEATVIKVSINYTKSRKNLCKVRIQDMTGDMDLTYFSRFAVKSLKEGKKYYFSGKVDAFNGKPTMSHPVSEPADQEQQTETGKLVPVYHSTPGINQKWFRTKIDYVLNQVMLNSSGSLNSAESSNNPSNIEQSSKSKSMATSAAASACKTSNSNAFTKGKTLVTPSKDLDAYLKDPVPQKIRRQNNLVNLAEALVQIHFPLNYEMAKEAKRRLAFEELYLELLKVEHRKSLWEEKMQGVPLNITAHYQQQLDTLQQNLPFMLTDSQQQAIKEILQDLTQQHPMNRLLEGDVGTGKTIVAIFAAYLSYLNGYKTLYMAPTEILANQHFATFTNFLSEKFLGAVDAADSFGSTETPEGSTPTSLPKIKLKTGSKKTNLHEDDFDIAIGTHALLYMDEPLEDVGLVIIDEQHRFGVEQRTRLMELGKGEQAPNLLTMTATPIPRTLALTLYGDLSISLLKTPPNKNKKITTKVIPESKRAAAFEWIRGKNEPSFIVCPLIEESEHESFENVKSAQAEFERLSQGVFKDLNLGLLHGRMKPSEKQEVVSAFEKGEIDVLVSTPVIEVGIDIPAATIMVIESAERYGLASLHQLRGRVGRGEKEAFCLIFMSNFSRPSYERLKHLERSSNGLELAEIDMQMRGQGDLYGTMQHGFKQFKLASLSDLDLIELARDAAAEVYSKYVYLRSGLRTDGDTEDSQHLDKISKDEIDFIFENFEEKLVGNN